MIKGILIYVLILFSSSSFAQDSYLSHYYQYIQGKLPDSCKQQLAKLDTSVCTFHNQQFTIIKTGEVQGTSAYAIKVFDRGLNIPYNEVFDFVESELLFQLVAASSQRKKRKHNSQVSLNLQPKKLHLSDFLSGYIQSGENNFTLLENEKQYSIQLFWGIHSLKLSFPFDYTIILGKDKILLQKELADNIIKQKDVVLLHNDIIKKVNLLPLDSILYYKGGKFLIPDMNQNVYYYKNGQSLVFDKNHLNESFSNLFISKLWIEKEIEVNLKFKQYQGTQIVSKSLKQILSVFEKAEYSKYFAVEELTKDEIRGSLIIYNQLLGYIHLFDVKADIATLFSQSVELDAVLYSFIPTTNIKELFGTYEKAKDE